MLHIQFVSSKKLSQIVRLMPNFTLFFSRTRVKYEMLSLFSRNEKWTFISFHSFREWKVKWKCIEIEIENEKWNENASRSRSRSEISKKISRILEKRDSRRLLTWCLFNGFVCLVDAATKLASISWGRGSDAVLTTNEELETRTDGLLLAATSHHSPF